ncbi:MAG: adenylate/guanylate cyclase domain-containing protein [Acidobacteriota bacterium]
MSSLDPILYVDGNTANIDAFSRTFGEFYDIHPATSAQEVLGILRSREIHLILSDQRMQDLTGVQLFEAIRVEYPDPIRMIVTDQTDARMIIKAINDGRIYRFVSRPWDAKELKVTLDRALESYDLEMRNRRLQVELEQRAAREEKIRRIFQRYVPAAVVNELLDAKQNSHFLGEVRVVSVLFFAIHNFTRLTSRLTPEDLMVFLNDYHTTINRIVARNNGTIKDAKLAVFGAPISSLNNAENSVQAALEMIEAIAELNHNDIEDLLGEPLRFGIGINLGEVIAGNIGSEEKMEYTVIGDTVNTAARIQELTQADPGSILMSRSVLHQAGHRTPVEALDPLRLRGRTETIQLYRVRPEG